MLQPFLLRRSKNEVLNELPSKTEIIYEVELSAEERTFYENIRELTMANLEEGSLNPIQTYPKRNVGIVARGNTLGHQQLDFTNRRKYLN